jgi:hypothetical protein
VIAVFIAALLDVAGDCVLAVALVLWFRSDKWTERRRLAIAFSAIGFGLLLVACALIGSRLGMAANGFCACFGAWDWWRRRKDRRRTLDMTGEKSRALRDALVRKAREATRPRPALRPVPGGAR